MREKEVAHTDDQLGVGPSVRDHVVSLVDVLALGIRKRLDGFESDLLGSSQVGPSDLFSASDDVHVEESGGLSHLVFSLCFYLEEDRITPIGLVYLYFAQEPRELGEEGCGDIQSTLAASPSD